MPKMRGVWERDPEREPGIYWIRYADASGKIRREKAGTFATARDLYHVRKAEVLKGKKLPDNFRKATVYVAQLLDDALSHSKLHKRSHRTDIPRFTNLKEWLGSHPGENLTPKELERVLARESVERKWAPSTFNHYRSLLSLSYRLGIQNRKVSTNPVKSVPHRREDNNRVRFLTDEEERELRKVLKAKSASHIPEFDLALNTGLRKGSMYGLTWEMVDWKSKMLHVPRTKNEEPVHLPLNDSAVAALKAVHTKGEKNRRVFRSAKTGEPLENGRHWFDDAVLEAKIEDFHWHDLRHTFASRLRMQGAALEDIADLLGHKSLMMTRRYAHLGPSKLHAVVSLLKPTDTKTSTKRKRKTATSS